MVIRDLSSFSSRAMIAQILQTCLPHYMERLTVNINAPILCLHV